MSGQDRRYRVYLRADPEVDTHKTILDVLGKLNAETFLIMRSIGNSKVFRCPTIEITADTTLSHLKLWETIQQKFGAAITGFYCYELEKYFLHPQTTTRKAAE